MIEEPPLLRIRRNPPRPTAAQIAAFQGALTGMVTDSMEGIGALDARICPLDPLNLPTTFVGVALVADNRPGDLLATLAALDSLKPGDVLVATAQGFQGCAAVGDRLTGMARNAGAIALVTDGPVRDLAGLRKVGLPVFCTGQNPNSPVAKGPGRVGFGAQIGGQWVNSGDILVGDSDGVVVVPFARIDEIARTLAHVQSLEAALDKEVDDGLTVPDSIRALLASDQTVYEN